MNNLKNLIYGALKGQNNNQRSNSQAQIINLRQKNPFQFFLRCAMQMNDQSNDNFIKQASGTVLGRSAITKNNNGVYYWNFLSSQQKNTIKDLVLNVLISKDIALIRTGAHTISQFASLQISNNNWLDLVDAFAENVQHNQILIKKASIMTIGYLCQQLNFLNASINSRTCQQFFGSIIIGSKQQNQPTIVNCSLKALKDSLAFLQPILENRDVRDLTFKILIQNMINQQFTRQCYQGLFQFVKVCYIYLGQYLQKIIEITYNHMLQRNQLTILALQLWDSIGTQYSQLLQNHGKRIKNAVNVENTDYRNYIQLSKNKILPQVLRCMIIKNQKDLSFPQMRQSGIKTLSVFAQVCHRDVIDTITQAISFIINSSHFGQRQASALIFSTLCEYPDKQYIKHCFSNGFSHLYGLLSDQQVIVIKNTIGGFTRLLETFPQVVLWHQNCKDILLKFLMLLQNNDQQICLSTLSVLISLTDNLSKHSYPIRSQPEFLLQRIVAYYDKYSFQFNEELKQTNQKVILIILNLIISTDHTDIIIGLIQFAHHKYYLIIQKNQHDGWLLANHMTSIIHTCMLSLRNKINEEALMDKICQMINFHIKRFGIESQGLSLISSLAIAYNKKFLSRIDHFWPYILHGLQLIQDRATFQTALNCVGDCGRILQQKFHTKSKQILQRLINYIHNNIHRQQKILILSCIGDMILGMKCQSELYINQIIKICDLCFNAVYQLQKEPNSLEYVQQLKMALVDLYQCLTFAAHVNKKPNRELFQHFPHLAYFVVRTCDRSLNPTINYLKTCLILLFDNASFLCQDDIYRQKINQILDSPQIKNLIQVIHQIKDKTQLYQLINLIYNRKK